MMLEVCNHHLIFFIDGIRRQLYKFFSSCQIVFEKDASFLANTLSSEKGTPAQAKYAIVFISPRRRFFGTTFLDLLCLDLIVLSLTLFRKQREIRNMLLIDVATKTEE